MALPALLLKSCSLQAGSGTSRSWELSPIASKVPASCQAPAVQECILTWVHGESLEEGHRDDEGLEHLLRNGWETCQRVGQEGILSMLANIQWAGAERMGQSCFQRCPATGRGANGALKFHTNMRRTFLLWGWQSTQTSCQTGHGVSFSGNIQTHRGIFLYKLP